MKYRLSLIAAGLFICFLFIKDSFSAITVIDARTRESISDIGPSNSTFTSSTTVTLAAGGASRYNCLDYAVVSSTTNLQFYILDGGTTIYYVRVTTGTLTHSTPRFDPPLCGSANTALLLKGNFGTTTAEATINYKGYVGK